MADVLFDNFTERFTVMTDGYINGTEILNGSEENTTDHDP